MDEQAQPGQDAVLLRAIHHAGQLLEALQVLCQNANLDLRALLPGSLFERSAPDPLAPQPAGADHSGANQHGSAPSLLPNPNPLPAPPPPCPAPAMLPAHDHPQAPVHCSQQATPSMAPFPPDLHQETEGDVFMDCDEAAESPSVADKTLPVPTTRRAEAPASAPVASQYAAPPAAPPEAEPEPADGEEISAGGRGQASDTQSTDDDDDVDDDDELDSDDQVDMNSPTKFCFFMRGSAKNTTILSNVPEMFSKEELATRKDWKAFMCMPTHSRQLDLRWLAFINSTPLEREADAFEMADSTQLPAYAPGQLPPTFIISEPITKAQLLAASQRDLLQQDDKAHPEYDGGGVMMIHPVGGEEALPDAEGLFGEDVDGDESGDEAGSASVSGGSDSEAEQGQEGGQLKRRLLASRVTKSGDLQSQITPEAQQALTQAWSRISTIACQPLEPDQVTARVQQLIQLVCSAGGSDRLASVMYKLEVCTNLPRVLEAVANGLDALRTQWTLEKRPKLAAKARRIWQQARASRGPSALGRHMSGAGVKGSTHQVLAEWRQALHVCGERLLGLCEQLVKTNLSSVEGFVKKRDPCSSLEPTLIDILECSYRLEIGSLPEAPQDVPLPAKPQRKASAQPDGLLFPSQLQDNSDDDDVDQDDGMMEGVEMGEPRAGPAAGPRSAAGGPRSAAGGPRSGAGPSANASAAEEDLGSQDSADSDDEGEEDDEGEGEEQGEAEDSDEHDSFIDDADVIPDLDDDDEDDDDEGMEADEEGRRRPATVRNPERLKTWQSKMLVGPSRWTRPAPVPAHAEQAAGEPGTQDASDQQDDVMADGTGSGQGAGGDVAGGEAGGEQPVERQLLPDLVGDVQSDMEVDGAVQTQPVDASRPSGGGEVVEAVEEVERAQTPGMSELSSGVQVVDLTMPTGRASAGQAAAADPRPDGKAWKQLQGLQPVLPGSAVNKILFWGKRVCWLDGYVALEQLSEQPVSWRLQPDGSVVDLQQVRPAEPLPSIMEQCYPLAWHRIRPGQTIEKLCAKHPELDQYEELDPERPDQVKVWVPLIVLKPATPARPEYRYTPHSASEGQGQEGMEEVVSQLQGQWHSVSDTDASTLPAPTRWLTYCTQPSQWIRISQSDMQEGRLRLCMKYQPRDSECQWAVMQPSFTQLSKARDKWGKQRDSQIKSMLSGVRKGTRGAVASAPQHQVALARFVRRMARLPTYTLGDSKTLTQASGLCKSDLGETRPAAPASKPAQRGRKTSQPGRACRSVLMDGEDVQLPQSRRGKSSLDTPTAGGGPGGVGGKSTGKRGRPRKDAAMLAEAREKRAEYARKSQLLTEERRMRLIQESASRLQLPSPDAHGFLKLFPDREQPKIAGCFTPYLKPHQWEGLRFLWTNLVDATLSSTPGEEDLTDAGGVVLAHTMGLGKTLTTIAMLHMYFCYRKEGRALMVVPANVVFNCYNEFCTWLPRDGVCAEQSSLHPDKVHLCSQGSTVYNHVHKWYSQEGSVLIMSSSLFTQQVMVEEQPAPPAAAAAGAGGAAGAQPAAGAGAAGTAAGAAPAAGAAEQDMDVDARANIAVPDEQAAGPSAATQQPDAAAAAAAGGGAQAGGRAGRGKKKELTAEERAQKLQVKHMLLTGPAVVVADEAHELKNKYTKFYKAMKQIKTWRRIALTGYPLQNDMREYYTMLTWVRAKCEEVLGSTADFEQEFVSTIDKGRKQGATEGEKLEMMRALLLLHALTEGYVQACPSAVLRDELSLAGASKTEHVLVFELTPEQGRLYNAYTDILAQQHVKRTLFSDLLIFQKICNTPGELEAWLERAKPGTDLARDLEADDIQLVVEDNSQDAPAAGAGGGLSQATAPGASQVPPAAAAGAGGGKGKGGKKPPGKEVCKIPVAVIQALQETLAEVKASRAEAGQEDSTTWTEEPKLKFIRGLLRECQRNNEKLVLYSQSLDVLALLEREVKQVLGGDPAHGQAWWRITGMVPPKKRGDAIKQFEEHAGFGVFLISTRAGAVGINLTSARRLVVFDVPWNPVHNAQAIARVYRMGQTHPVFIYRLMYMKTCEHSIYTVNVAKEELSHKVIDKKAVKKQAEPDKEYYDWTPSAPLGVERLGKKLRETQDELLQRLLLGEDGSGKGSDLHRHVSQYHLHSAMILEDPMQDWSKSLKYKVVKHYVTAAGGKDKSTKGRLMRLDKVVSKWSEDADLEGSNPQENEVLAQLEDLVPPNSPAAPQAKGAVPHSPGARPRSPLGDASGGGVNITSPSPSPGGAPNVWAAFQQHQQSPQAQPPARKRPTPDIKPGAGGGGGGGGGSRAKPPLSPVIIPMQNSSSHPLHAKLLDLIKTHHNTPNNHKILPWIPREELDKLAGTEYGRALMCSPAASGLDLFKVQQLVGFLKRFEYLAPSIPASAPAPEDTHLPGATPVRPGSSPQAHTTGAATGQAWAFSLGAAAAAHGAQLGQAAASTPGIGSKRPRSRDSSPSSKRAALPRAAKASTPGATPKPSWPLPAGSGRREDVQGAVGSKGGGGDEAGGSQGKAVSVVCLTNSASAPSGGRSSASCEDQGDQDTATSPGLKRASRSRSREPAGPPVNTCRTNTAGMQPSPHPSGGPALGVTPPFSTFAPRPLPLSERYGVREEIARQVNGKPTLDGALNLGQAVPGIKPEAHKSNLAQAAAAAKQVGNRPVAGTQQEVIDLCSEDGE